MQGWSDSIDEGGAVRRPVPPGDRAPHPSRPADRDPEADLGTFAVGRRQAADWPGTDRDRLGTGGDRPGTDGDRPGTDRDRPGTDRDWPGTDGDWPRGDGDWPGTDDRAEWPVSDHSDADRSGRDPGSSGRHRRPNRLPGPLGLAVAVVALLGLLGVGAATVLPDSLAQAPGELPAGNAAAATDGAEPSEADPAQVGSPSGAPTVGATPTSTVPAPRPTGTPRVTTAPPTRKATPTPRRTPSRTPSKASTGDSREAQVLEIVNQERAENGCGAVVINSKLATAARSHSQDQAENTNMSHTGSDGSTFTQRADRAGYTRAIGENVAMGYTTAARVMDGWMNSEGHRANILNCDARAIGIGVATGPDNALYWTQVFGAVA